MKSGRTRGVVEINLGSLHDLSVTCTIHAFILTRLTGEVPSFTINEDEIPLIKNLQLADPNFGSPGSIDIIIGSDAFNKIICPDMIPATLTTPLAQLTIFGWVLSGPVTPISYSSFLQNFHCSVDKELENLLLRFWTQEETSLIKESSLSPEEQICEEHYKVTHSRDSQGRYIVRLPFKKPINSLGDSKKEALRSLNRLSKRMNSDYQYRERYSDFIREYEELNHMRRVPKKELNVSPTYYLPHHGVLREQSTTTKLRVVFNASSPTETGSSLNDILHSGRKLQNEISDVLL